MTIGRSRNFPHKIWTRSEIGQAIVPLMVVNWRKKQYHGLRVKPETFLQQGIWNYVMLQSEKHFKSHIGIHCFYQVNLIWNLKSLIPNVCVCVFYHTMWTILNIAVHTDKSLQIIMSLIADEFEFRHSAITNKIKHKFQITLIFV